MGVSGQNQNTKDSAAAPLTFELLLQHEISEQLERVGRNEFVNSDGLLSALGSTRRVSTWRSALMSMTMVTRGEFGVAGGLVLELLAYQKGGKGKHESTNFKQSRTVADCYQIVWPCSF